MTTTVGFNLTTNVGIHMTTNVSSDMTTKVDINLRKFVENSRHPTTLALGLGGSELRLLIPFPRNPGNPGMISKNAKSYGGLHFSNIPCLQQDVKKCQI